MMELDQKALEAARLAAWSKRDGGNIDFDAAIDTAIRAYLASLPSDDEVGRVCERLIEHADCTDNGGCAEHQFDSGSKLMREAAALIRSQAAALAAAKAERDVQREAKEHARRANERAEAAVAEKDKALEGSDSDLYQFMRRLDAQWFLAQNWWPKSMTDAKISAARRAHSKDGGEHDGA